MSNTIRPDFCFSASVLSNVDAVDIAECFGLAPIVDDDEDLFGDLNDAIEGDDNDDGEVFASSPRATAETAVVLVRH